MAMQFNVQWFDEMDSTNTRLIEEVRRDPHLPSGTVWAAKSQTAGRGRLGRKWDSFSDGNLLFSLYQRTHASLSHLPSFSMAMSIAVDEMLQMFHVHSNLKWPNDVQVQGRKIAGLLAERAGDDGVVIGIGLNVNMTSLQAAQIDQPATSMAIETGAKWDVNDVLKTLLNSHWPFWYERWKSLGFSGLRDRWIQRCGGLDLPVVVRDGENLLHGTLAGFGNHGELLLRLPGGRVQTIWAGDILTPL